MSELLYIPDLIKAVVDAVATKLATDVFFDFGHIQEIVKNLAEKEGATSIAKRKKYPLVWLVMDFAEERGELNTYAKVSLNIIVTTGTSAQATMQSRRDTTFLPVLYPIYEELLNQLKASLSFVTPPSGIVHTKIDRPYWSGEGQGLASVFNEPIDAIQIKDLKLTVKRPRLIC